MDSGRAGAGLVMDDEGGRVKRNLIAFLFLFAGAASVSAGPIRGLVDLATGVAVPDADVRYVTSTNEVYTNALSQSADAFGWGNHATNGYAVVSSNNVFTGTNIFDVIQTSTNGDINGTVKLWDGSMQAGYGLASTDIGYGCVGILQLGVRFITNSTVSHVGPGAGNIQQATVNGSSAVIMTGNVYSSSQKIYSTQTSRAVMSGATPPVTGSMQAGRLYGGATMTNENSAGCIQLGHLTTNQHSLVRNSIGSIGLGAVTITNATNVIVVGNGQVAHGDGSVTAGGGFWTTNSHASNDWVVNYQSLTNYVALNSAGTNSALLNANNVFKGTINTFGGDIDVGTNAVRGSRFGNFAGDASSGSGWSAVGEGAGFGATHTNSHSFGRWAGNAARGDNRMYLDVYPTNPLYAAGESTNDTIFLDSDSRLYLGGGPARAGVSNGGVVLRGPVFVPADATNGAEVVNYRTLAGHVSGTAVTNIINGGTSGMTGNVTRVGGNVTVSFPVITNAYQYWDYENGTNVLIMTDGTETFKIYFSAGPQVQPGNFGLYVVDNRANMTMAGIPFGTDMQVTYAGGDKQRIAAITGNGTISFPTGLAAFSSTIMLEVPPVGANLVGVSTNLTGGGTADIYYGDGLSAGSQLATDRWSEVVYRSAQGSTNATISIYKGSRP